MRARFSSCALLPALALLFTQPARAEGVISLPEASPEKAEPTSSPYALEEIVVTAQKREEAIEDAPISLLVFDEESLERKGINGLADIKGSAPGLQVETFSTANSTLQLYIRGVGIVDSQITQDPAIGVYVDGAYLARSMGLAVDFADIERIEVLRGPQGTLYGRNTTGGAVNIITERPSTDYVTSKHQLSIGNRNLARINSSLNTPITDQIAARVSLGGMRQDGFVDNTGPGGDFGDRNAIAARIDLRADLQTGWLVDYSYDHSESGYYNQLYQSVTTPESNKGAAELIKREAQRATIYSDQRLRSLATGMPLEESNVRVKGHTFTVSKDLGGISAKYIGAHRSMTEAFYVDLGGGAGSTDFRVDSHRYDGPSAALYNGGPIDLGIPLISHDQTTHELQLSGNLTNSLRFMIGGYLFEEDAVEEYVPMHQFSAFVNPAGQLLPDGLNDLILGAANVKLASFLAIYNEAKNESTAGYAQLSWTPPLFDERTEITLGYRHTKDKRHASKTRTTNDYLEVNALDLIGVPIPAPSSGVDEFDGVTADRAFSNDSFSIIFEAEISKTINMYAKYVESYKSGGFNVRDPQLNSDSGQASDGVDYGFGFEEGFKPELVTSVEIGASGRAFKNRARFGANVFYMDYKDMQINFLVGGTFSDTKATNAGKSRLAGLELDGAIRISKGTRLEASYAYLDAEITEVINSDGDNVADRYQFNRAPRHSAAIGISTTLASGDWGDLLADAGGMHISERNGGANVGQDVGLRGYSTVNAGITFQPRKPLLGGNLTARLWIRNALDEVYEISAISVVPQADRAVLWGEPRTFGLDLFWNLE